MARKKTSTKKERPKKRTNKELAMGMLYDALTGEAFDAEDAIEHAKIHDMNIREAKAEKVAQMANDILNRYVEKRVKGYLEKRGDDLSSPTPLAKAASD